MNILFGINWNKFRTLSEDYILVVKATVPTEYDAVIRGLKATLTEDKRVVDSTLQPATENSTHAVRVWRPHRQRVFGLRDRSLGHPNSRFMPIERSIVGRTIVYSMIVTLAQYEPLMIYKPNLITDSGRLHRHLDRAQDQC